MTDVPRRDPRLTRVAITAPLIVGHVAVFLMPRNPTALIAYMLGYAASLAAASLSREHRHLLLIPAAGFTIGLTAEVVGVNTGLPFGRYEYVYLRAPRVLGVPLSVPLMWGFYAYLTYLISSSLITREGRAWSILRVVHASLLMVNLDLAMDPFMVSEAHAWVWISGWGPKWFGVPASNFLGWFIVSSTILTTHELLTKKAPTIKAQELSIPYACLTLLFASPISQELLATTAALTTALITIPATTTKTH